MKLRFYEGKNRNVGSDKLNKSNKSAVKIITNRLYQVEERISGIKDKDKEILHSESNKGKK
jgi:hypothetical protein